MKNPFIFLQEARGEFRKIVWPTRNETTVSTIMVLIMVIFLTLFFGLVDIILRFGLSTIIRIFS